MTTTIYLRDAALARLGEVEEFTQLALVLRFNAPSSWTLTLDAASPAAGLYEDDGGIIVVRNGTTLLSGPVETVQRSRVMDSNGVYVSTVTLSGSDDTTYLRRRLALPSATVPFSTDYDTQTGVAETVMRHYVGVNLGPSAPSGRKLTTLALQTDLGRGSSVTGRARMDNLLALLQSLALAGGDLGFRVVQNGSALEFEVYEPADLADTAVFSVGLGNLAGYSYEQTIAAANHVYVGGGGEGSLRTFVERTAAGSTVGSTRAEVFQDRRDTTTTGELQQAGDETLAEAAGQTALSISPVDTAAMTYGVDYGLGDRVTVVVDGVEITDLVREVSLTLTAEDERITPVVGSPGASAAVPRIFAALAKAGKRITNLERR